MTRLSQEQNLASSFLYALTRAFFVNMDNKSVPSNYKPIQWTHPTTNFPSLIQQVKSFIGILMKLNTTRNLRSTCIMTSNSQYFPTLSDHQLYNFGLKK
jgi:hypothetical protein